MTLQGTITQSGITLDQPSPLPEGTRVEVVINPLSAPGSDKVSGLSQRLLKHAGTVAGLPEDLAEQHDHYLHGTPKR